ncbi:MAG: pyruvate ferredoxin oxidoreductase [Actinobacteria bacterium]|nr:pyruvate ferredoxin oxidoreductase [Actinomycetota bacterium]
MPKVTTLAASGNQMVGEAFRQAEPDVIAAYPITPQTAIVESYAKFVADGRVHTEFVTVESEHSSMSACIGASAAGARVATATSSQGLAYMWEVLHIAAGMRLPIVMANANRAIAAPINIHCDHSDVMGARDTGWVIFFAETAQEAYDNTVISFRVAEHPDVLLPVMTTLDGFITTHAMERCELLDDETVKAFIGEYKPKHSLLDLENPVGHGMFANLGGAYMQAKLAERRALDNAAPIIKSLGDEWAAICGRSFDMIDCWGMEDAEYAIVILGSAAGNARHVARELRAQGVKAGVVRVRVFRPFPYAELAEALSGVKAVAVLDRSDSFGAQAAPLALEVYTALFDAPVRPAIRNYVYGLGGADVTLEILHQVYDDLDKLAAGEANPGLVYLGIQ